MPVVNHRRAAVAAVLLLALTACADSTAPVAANFTDPDAAIASLTADAVGEHLDMLRGQGLPGLGLPGLLFPSPVDSGSRCGGPGGPGGPDGPMPCPPMEREGMTFSRTVTYFDEAGIAQSAYDSLTTASINFEVSASNGDSGNARGMTIRNERDLTVSGLLGGETSATWNGTGTSYRKGAPGMGAGPGMGGPGMGGGMGVGRGGPRGGRPPRDSLRPRGDGRVIEATTSSTIDNVVVPVPQTEEAWPLSGTITQDATVTITFLTGETRTSSRTAVVSFNGTQFVPLVINGATTIIDLKARPGPGPFGPRPGRP
ncbi:MAG: hypothetical protein Q8Q85_07470 [Gemmatimonadales bacterium]|nr:hypothetical protein [Gemmatimonadales bacterium]